MDSLRHNLPAPAHPKRLGQPYHGLLRGGVLTLSNGRQIAWPFIGNAASDPVSTAGDCYVLRVPGTPPVTLPPAELAAEAAAGREWRSYALLNGVGRSYGGIPVGIKAWLYAAPDGSVWRIECPQLNTPLQPVAADNPPIAERWFYPPTLDFEFRIRRFGVIAPGGESAALYTRTVTGQSLGGAHQADPVYPETSSALTPPRRRLYIGDGRAFQYMPINIEDVNGTGSRVLFGVNRSLNQSIWSSDYAAPRAWIEVSVSGSGASIQVEMAVLRVDAFSAPTVASAVTTSTAMSVDFVNSRGGVGTATSKDTGVVNGSMEPYLPQTEFNEITGAVSSSSGDGRYAGAYYDDADTVQWVRAVGLYQEVRAQVSGSSTFNVVVGPTVETEDSDYTYLSAFWKIDYQWHMTGSRIDTTRGGAAMGPHGFSLPDLVGRHDVSEQGSEAGWFDNEEPPANHYQVSRASSGRIDGAAAAWSYNDPQGLYNIQALIGVHVDRTSSVGGYVYAGGALTPTGHFWGGAAIRDFESVYVRRVTNRVYAIVGSNYDAGPFPVPYPQGARVIAIGTPAGWISGTDIANANYASYNPGTGQLAHSPSDTLGFV